MHIKLATRLTLICHCIVTCNGGLSYAEPSLEQGQWLKFMLALQGRRLVVYVKDETSKEREYVLIKDVIIPESIPSEGYIALQHEEAGKAQGAMFDNLRIWSIDDSFSLDDFANHRTRKSAPRLGAPAITENFADESFPNLKPIEGQWCTREKRLTCENITQTWPRIRTTRKFRDFFMRFDLYRAESSDYNWVGAALRTNETCQQGVGFQVLVRNSLVGPRFVAGLAENEALEAEVREFARRKQEERERADAEARRRAEEETRRAEEAQRARAVEKPRWERILGKKLTSLGEVGEDVRVGDVRWKVLGAKDLGNKLPDKFGGTKKTPGRFIGVAIEVENLSKDPLTFMERKLCDKDGRTFSSLPDAVWYFGDATVFILENINPNVPRRFAQVYEVPHDASDFVVLVSNLELLLYNESAIGIGL